MRHTILGKSGSMSHESRSAPGSSVGDWGPTDAVAAREAIRRAADKGVTLFDTAQGYGFGQSEQLLASALSGLPREELVIATKGGLRSQGDGIVRDASASWIREGVEASLRALGTEYIDLYQVHWPDPATPFEETAGELGKLVADGKVLHVGVSNFEVGQMEEFSSTLPVETLQPPYHLFRREIEADVLPYAAANDIGVLVYGPLAHGLLSGHLTPDTLFDAHDWRSKSPVFQRGFVRRATFAWSITSGTWPTRSSGSPSPSSPWPGRSTTQQSTPPSWGPATRPMWTRPWLLRTWTSTTR